MKRYPYLQQNVDGSCSIHDDEINHVDFASLDDAWAAMPERLRVTSTNLATLEEQVAVVQEMRDIAWEHLGRTRNMIDHLEKLITGRVVL